MRLDSELWRQSIARAGVDSIITAKDAALMRSKLNSEPPLYTAKEARKLVSGLASSTENLVRDSVKKVFTALTEVKFRTGGGASWKKETRLTNKNEIKKTFRASLFYGGLPSYWHTSESHAVIFLNDLELATYLLNSEERPHYPNRLGDRMSVAYSRDGSLQAETKYISVQIFLNGNVIVKFLCEETLRRLNAWGSDGRSVSDVSSEAGS